MKKLAGILVGVILITLMIAGRQEAKSSGPSKQASVAAKPSTLEPLLVIEKFVEVFNQHDLDAMIALTEPDVQWLSVDGEKIAVETAGHDALRNYMKRYFTSIPSAKSKIERSMVAGQYVTIWERASWQAKSGEKSQSALAVYELKNNRIFRVWYYPMVK
jgi:hypothetical protein